MSRMVFGATPARPSMGGRAGVCCRVDTRDLPRSRHVTRTLARPSAPAEDPAGSLFRRAVDAQVILCTVRAHNTERALAKGALLDELQLALLDEPVAVVDEREVADVELGCSLSDVERQTVMLIGAPPEMPVYPVGWDAFPSRTTVASLGIRSTDRFGSVPFNKGLSATFAFLLGRKLMVRRSPVSIGAPVRGCLRCAEGRTF